MTAHETPFDDLQLIVSGSGGLVSRRPALVLVLPEVPLACRDEAEKLLNLCLGEPHLDAPVLLRRVAYLLAESEATGMPGFGLLVRRSDSRVTLLAYGKVDVELADGALVSAAELVTWIERPLDGATDIVVRRTGASGPDEFGWPAQLDLRAGVVPGGAVRFATGREGPTPSVAMPGRVPAATAPVSVAGPTMVADSPAAPDSASLDATPAVAAPSAASVVAEPAQPAATPVAAEAAPPAAGRVAAESAPPESLLATPLPPGGHNVTAASPVLVDPATSFEAVLLGVEPVAAVGAPLPIAEDNTQDNDHVLVEGVVCSRGHFNDPGSAYCSVCGISMVQRTHEYISAPRPPLGVLIFDDGSAFTVDGDYVLGREPELSPMVVAGSARPLSLTDPDNAVSRVHATLRLEGWQVLLEDRGSSNGTFVDPARDENWLRLEPGHPVTLSAGQRVRFGRRVAVFESHVRPR